MRIIYTKIAIAMFIFVWPDHCTVSACLVLTPTELVTAIEIEQWPDRVGRGDMYLALCVCVGTFA